MKKIIGKNETEDTCSTFKMDELETAVFTVNGCVVHVCVVDGVVKVSTTTTGSKVAVAPSSHNAVDVVPFKGRLAELVQEDK